jgi:hypothetical protein
MTFLPAPHSVGAWCLRFPMCAADSASRNVRVVLLYPQILIPLNTPAALFGSPKCGREPMTVGGIGLELSHFQPMRDR